MELARLVKLDGNTMSKLNAATRKTLAMPMKSWLTESASVLPDTEEMLKDSVNHLVSAQQTVSSTK